MPAWYDQGLGLFAGPISAHVGTLAQSFNRASCRSQKAHYQRELVLLDKVATRPVAMRQWMHGHLIEGASRAELARSAICLTIFSRSILARLGLFASFFFPPLIFGVPPCLCFSSSVASPLFHAARPRLRPVCPLEIDYKASLLLFVAIRWDVCWEQEVPRASECGTSTKRSFLSAVVGAAWDCSGKSKKPLFVAGSFLSPDLAVFVSTLYSMAPERWIRRGGCL